MTELATTAELRLHVLPDVDGRELRVGSTVVRCDGGDGDGVIATVADLERCLGPTYDGGHVLILAEALTSLTGALWLPARDVRTVPTP